jgi:ribosomal protein L21
VIIIGIDPGCAFSGLVHIGTHHADNHGLITAEVITNKGLIEYLRAPKGIAKHHIAIEDIVSYGKSIGKTTIETAVFIGRVIEAAQTHKISVFRYSRRDYGFWITGGQPISDASIRAGLESHYGGYGKGEPLNILKGASDKRSAFAVAKYHEHMMTTWPKGDF